MADRTKPPVQRDLFREYRDEYRATGKPALVKIGTARYLEAAGSGAPGGPAFGAAIGSLYQLVYALKFRHKARGRDFKVAALECFWDRPPFSGKVGKKELAKLPWRLAVRVPEFVTRPEVKALGSRRTPKRGAAPSPVTLQSIREGDCIQMLHVGPYSKETATVQQLAKAARAEGLAFAGSLHEIYLSDPRRVPATRLRTIVRIGVRKVRSS